jgi:aminoglycoside phosphotransferase (APT) family kinase protein
MRWLVEHTPVSVAATLIHNDFKLNNILMSAQDLAQPVAVLDWEMATIGDPLFDLAITLAYWVQSDDSKELRSLIPSVTTFPGFISRTEFMERYSAQSGRDLSSMHFYMTFAYFKLAVILQQIYVRWKRGQTQDDRFAIFGQHVRVLINHAARLVEKRNVE